MSVKEQARKPRRYDAHSPRTVLALALGVLLLAFCSDLPARADDMPAQPASATTAITDSTSSTHVQLKISLPTRRGTTVQSPEVANALTDNELKLSLEPSLYAFRRQPNPVSAATKAIPIDLRLGAEISPQVKFDGGIDLTIPVLSLGAGLSTRIDADAIVSANFGGVTTLYPLTFDQVFSLHIPGGPGIYLGGGIGPYIGNTTRFGGKVFAGGMLTSQLGLEGTVHFPGFGDPLLTVQLRIGL